MALTILEPEPPRTLALPPGRELSLGRGPGVDVQVASLAVSRRHCAVGRERLLGQGPGYPQRLPEMERGWGRVQQTNSLACTLSRSRLDRQIQQCLAGGPTHVGVGVLQKRTQLGS